MVVFVCASKPAAASVIRKSLALNIGYGECAGVDSWSVGWPPSPVNGPHGDPVPSAECQVPKRCSDVTGAYIKLVSIRERRKCWSLT